MPAEARLALSVSANELKVNPKDRVGAAAMRRDSTDMRQSDKDDNFLRCSSRFLTSDRKKKRSDEMSPLDSVVSNLVVAVEGIKISEMI